MRRALMRYRIAFRRVLDRARRGGWRLGEVSGSAVLLLLFAEVASIVAAWLVLPAVVEFRNVLDAG
jgi:hypothetical protein